MYCGQSGYFLNKPRNFVLIIFPRLFVYEKQSWRDGRTSGYYIYRHLAESSTAISKLRVKPDICKVKGRNYNHFLLLSNRFGFLKKVGVRDHMTVTYLITMVTRTRPIIT